MAESDLIRGNVDTIILKVLYEGDRYGYDLIKQINARSDGQWEIKQPTVYACLKRLEKQGFISSYWDSSESDGGRRKYYSLTESGREVFLKYKNEFERATALFGGIISGDTPPVFIQPIDDYSDVEEEGYSLPKRRAKRTPKKAAEVEQQPQPTQQEQPEQLREQQNIFTFLEQQTERPAQSLHSEPERPVANRSVPPIEQEQPIEQDLGVYLADDEPPAANEPIPHINGANDDTTPIEALDPRLIIESLYAGENGESYSDARRRATFAPSDEIPQSSAPHPAQKPQATAPSPTQKPQAAASAPGQTYTPAPTAKPITPVTQSPAAAPTIPNAATPTASPLVGFPAEEESPARREYKTVLEELVDKFEVTAPDIRTTKQIPDAEQAATAAQRTEHAQSGPLVKVEQAVRELGNDVKVRSHNNSAKEFTTKNYYYSNRLLMTHYTILCISMFIVGLALFMLFYMGLHIRMKYDYLLYVGAGLLPIFMFIIAVICFANNADKTKRINVSYRSSIIIRCVIMLQVAVVIYCLNLIWGMPMSFSVNYLPAVVLPLAYALFIPISEIIFMNLLKSGRYAYNQ